MLCDAFFESLQYQENLLEKYYRKKGHVVIILASNLNDVFDYYANCYDKNQPEADYVVNGTRIVRRKYSLNILNKFRRIRDVKALLFEVKPDFIFVHDIHANILDAIAYKKQNPSCKVVMDYHADYSNSGKNWVSINILHKVIRNYFLQKSRKYLDKIYPVVPDSATFLHEVYGIPHHEMEVLPLGIDIDLIKSIEHSDKPKELRRQFKINEGDIVIFTGGKISRLKNIHLIIEALNDINNPKIHLIIVGKFNADETEYEDYIKTISDGKENIHFAGWVTGDDVYTYLCASDVAIFPSSQTVLYQQSLGCSVALIIGEEHINAKGKSFIYDVSYLNINNGIKIIKKGTLSRETVKEAILETIDNLQEMKKLSIEIADTMLDYNVIVDKTLDF